MSKKEQQLLEEVLALPPKVRAEMAEKLLASLEDTEISHIDRAWAKECDRRIKAIEAGKMEVVDGTEILRKLRNRS